MQTLITEHLTQFLFQNILINCTNSFRKKIKYTKYFYGVISKICRFVKNEIKFHKDLQNCVAAEECHACKFHKYANDFKVELTHM